MAFCRTWCFRSAYDELLTVGSRWTRLLAKTSTISGPAEVEVHKAVPRITVIPTLHVASIRFYDEVLRYMDEAVRKRDGNVKILLEGICDGKEDELLQMQEYEQIMNSPELQATMKQKADQNSLFPPDVMMEMCTELAINYEKLQEHVATVRFQECYLKPKMAATVGLHLFNDADLDMTEVQALLAKELEAAASKGNLSLPNSVPISQIGVFPRVRAAREKKVAEVARKKCIEWIGAEVEGEVIIPWGFFHTAQILRHICEVPSPSPSTQSFNATNKPSSPAAAPVSSATEKPKAEDFAAASSSSDRDAEVKPSAPPPGKIVLEDVFFVVEPNWAITVPFGVPEAVLRKTKTPPTTEEPEPIL